MAGRTDGGVPTPAQVPPDRTQSAPPALSQSSSFNPMNNEIALVECIYGSSPEIGPEVEDDFSQIEIPDYRTLEHEVNSADLRKLSSIGIPDDGNHRGVVWRLLLGYLPMKLSEWQPTLDHKRNIYIGFCEDFFHDVYDVRHGEEIKSRKRRRPGDPPPEVFAEQPLLGQLELPESLMDQWKKRGKDLHILEDVTCGWNALKVSEPKLTIGEDETPDWSDFITSAALLDEVRKDVVRTHPDLAFFLVPDLNQGKRRYAALERILFVWSKINKGVRYVQGMNELVSALFYVLANDTNKVWSSYAEADTYWMLSTLLGEMQDVFISDLDDADTGIQGRLSDMSTLLFRHDPQVKEHLEDLGIDVSFYAIRWWTTLLSREFLLPDTIRLWDSMFSSTHKDNFLRYVCVTMVMLIRESLLKADFSSCLKYLQSYPPCHMDNLLDSSKSLWIYESQILLACHKGGIPLHQALSTFPPPPEIIMAFGLRKGIAPKTRSEQLEEAGEKAAVRMEELTTAMAASASGWLGRANRFYKRNVDRYKESRITRSRSADDATPRLFPSVRRNASGISHSQSLTTQSYADPTVDAQSSADQDDTEDDEVYMAAILNAA